MIVMISVTTLERLRELSIDDGIGFVDAVDNSMVNIELSEEVFEQICEFWPSDDGVQSDEDIETAINIMLDYKQEIVRS